MAHSKAIRNIARDDEATFREKIRIGDTSLAIKQKPANNDFKGSCSVIRGQHDKKNGEGEEAERRKQGRY